MPFLRSKLVQMMWAERVDNDFVKQGYIFLRDGTCVVPIYGMPEGVHFLTNTKH